MATEQHPIPRSKEVPLLVADSEPWAIGISHVQASPGDFTFCPCRRFKAIAVNPIFAAHEPKAGELLGSSEYCLLLLVRDVLAGFLASLLAALAAHLLNF